METLEQQGSLEDQEPLHKRPRSSQDMEQPDANDGLAGLAAMAAAAALESDDAREVVLSNEHLLNVIFSHLHLEDLCRAAMVRTRWREVTSNPNFWRTINLKGRTVLVSKVRRLLAQHYEVRLLNARGVAFAPADLAHILPKLNQLESLELSKVEYERSELDCLSSHLPQLTRLVLAGGLVGRPTHGGDYAVLNHTRLEVLELEEGRAGRLRISAPCLKSLSLRDFILANVQVTDAGQLACLSVVNCAKMLDGALRALLCLEGQHAAVLPSLTSITLHTLPNASDETLRLAGQRHPAIARLQLAACSAVTGGGLGALGGYPALRFLSLEACDSITGANLATSVHQMAVLQELRVMGCTQVTTLRLQSHSLEVLALCGTRTLQELDLRCSRLAEVVVKPLNPGLAAAAALERVHLVSHALERLQWSAFPVLEHLKLQCPNLQEVDLSECQQLKDTVFESLGGDGSGTALDPLPTGCPRLRVLKLSECDGLRNIELQSQALGSLHLSQCRWLLSVNLDCPILTQLTFEECTHLERATLRSRHMRALGLGTCPRLAAISIESESLEKLDLRGCNQLEGMSLACPSLRAVDATFCSNLSDAAVASVASCDGLEELVLAVCSAVTVQGLGALSRLQCLRRLDLSYTPIEDPTPLYAACNRLTSLTLSNNYNLRPDALLPLFPPRAAMALATPNPGYPNYPLALNSFHHATLAATAATAATADSSASAGVAVGGPPRQAASACITPADRMVYQLPLLPELVELDVSYCPLPGNILATVLVRATRLRSLSVNGCHGGAVTDQLWPLLHRRVGAQQEGSAIDVAAAGAVPADSSTAPGTPAARVLLAPQPDWRGLVPEPVGPEASTSGGTLVNISGSKGGLAGLSLDAGLEPLLVVVPTRHHLRSLSMVGSKSLCCFYLGLVPAATALQHGLLIGGSTVTVMDGQQYVPVKTLLAGLRELRLSLSARLRCLALGLPDLRELQLNNCWQLEQLALHCPRLTRLSMQACRSMCEAALLAAVADCPKLQELDLQNCPQVTAEVVASIQRACPSLQTVVLSPCRPPSP